MSKKLDAHRISSTCPEFVRAVTRRAGEPPFAETACACTPTYADLPTFASGIEPTRGTADARAEAYRATYGPDARVRIFPTTVRAAGLRLPVFVVVAKDGMKETK